MKYKGKELKEITIPQVFDPPKQMFVWDDIDDCKAPYVRTVFAVIRTINGTTQVVGDCSLRWQHCAEIPEEAKPRRATNRELAKWLGTGIGEYRNKIGLVSNYYTYDESETDKEVCSSFTVRKWDDTDWHEPTVDYMGIEDKSAVHTNVTSECIDGKRKIAEADLWNRACSDENFFNEDEVKIGNQIWMNKNLDVSDGGEGIYFNEDNGEYYYTWEAAKRIADKIPGWHLPSRKEWNELVKATGYDAANLRVESWEGTDKYGFSASGAGYCNSSFNNVNYVSFFWTSDPDGNTAISRYFDGGTRVYERTYPKYFGFSVRLVKDK